METLRCEGLTKSFDAVYALKSVTLQFPSSGVVAIIGPNGAGKTTLLNVLTGFLKPDAGKCFLGDIELTSLPPHKIARLGIARSFQDLRLISRTSTLDNVLLARPGQRGERLIPALFNLGWAAGDDENIREAKLLLQRVGLSEYANELAGELSYGQQKLLSLACCLATNARVIFLDEPVAGVSPQMASRIVSLLRSISAEDKLILFIEHDLTAVRLADTIVVMDHGKIIAQGTPDDVLKRPEIMEAYLG